MTIAPTVIEGLLCCHPELRSLAGDQLRRAPHRKLRCWDGAAVGFPLRLADDAPRSPGSVPPPIRSPTKRRIAARRTEFQSVSAAGEGELAAAASESGGRSIAGKGDGRTKAESKTGPMAG